MIGMNDKKKKNIRTQVYNYFWITNSQTKSVITRVRVYTHLKTMKHACKNMCSCTKNDQIRPKYFFKKIFFLIIVILFIEI